MDKSELDMLNQVAAFCRLAKDLQTGYVPATEADIGNTAVIKIECPVCRRPAIWVKKEAV